MYNTVLAVERGRTTFKIKEHTFYENMRTNTSLICVHVARLRLDRGHELSSVHIQIRVCKHAIVYKTGKTRDYKTWSRRSRSIAVLVINQKQ